LLQRVLDRILAVTGAPLANIGGMQVVRYREGEYYATHHDQIHFLDPPLPEGARVLVAEQQITPTHGSPMRLH
jgi:hypothetical protein